MEEVSLGCTGGLDVICIGGYEDIRLYGKVALGSSRIDGTDMFKGSKCTSTLLLKYMQKLTIPAMVLWMKG